MMAPGVVACPVGRDGVYKSGGDNDSGIVSKDFLLINNGPARIANMDILILFSVFLAGIRISEAILCHDCTSWNPHCREMVDLPFPDAVSSVECKETQRCFSMMDRSEVVTRGCADWWQDSHVKLDYTGCRVQRSEWTGKEIWCFCDSDFCNSGAVEELLGHVDLKPGWEEIEGDDNQVENNAEGEGEKSFDDFVPLTEKEQVNRWD